MENSQGLIDDAWRFLRYFLPGLTFFVELVIYLFISSILLSPLCIAQLRDLLLMFLRDLNVGVLLIAFLFGSIGLGYLFSIFHHLWIPLFIDHRQVLKNAISKKRLGLKSYTENHDEQDLPSSMFLSRRGAWLAVTAIWHEMKEKDLIKSANPRIESLSNIMHGSGTTFFAALFAAVVWYLLYFRIHGVVLTWYMLLIPLAGC